MGIAAFVAVPPWYAIVLCTSPPLLLIGVIVGISSANNAGTSRFWPAVAGALGGIGGAWMACLPFPAFFREWNVPAAVVWTTTFLGTVAGAWVLSRLVIWLRGRQPPKP
jgi:hypothetical protein